MFNLQKYTMIAFFTLFLLLLAACGTSTNAQNSTVTTTTPTATAQSNNAYSYGNSTPTPTTTANSSTSSPLVKTAAATIAGKAVTLLTNAQGLTLYYFTPDTKTTTACSGGCAGTWPPLLATGSVTSNDASLSNKLAAVSDTNGNQVQYNGHFLYTYAGDSAAGQTNGEGIGGKWFVATTDLS